MTPENIIRVSDEYIDKFYRKSGHDESDIRVYSAYWMAELQVSMQQFVFCISTSLKQLLDEAGNPKPDPDGTADEKLCYLLREADDERLRVHDWRKCRDMFAHILCSNGRLVQCVERNGKMEEFASYFHIHYDTIDTDDEVGSAPPIEPNPEFKSLGIDMITEEEKEDGGEDETKTEDPDCSPQNKRQKID